MFSHMFSEGFDSVLYGTVLVLILTLAYVLFERYGNGISDIPGPFLASWSNAARFLAVHQRSIHKWNSSLHNEYGPVVRIGPRSVSFASIDALNKIHACREALPKSEFYDTYTQKSHPRYKGEMIYNMFNMRDVKHHGLLKRNLAGLYSKNTVQKFEYLVDKCALLLVKRLEDIAAVTASTAASAMIPGQGQDQSVDMSAWLHFYAFDSLCAINVSKTFGFLDKGTDIGGILRYADDFMYRFALLSQLPSISKVLRYWRARNGPAPNPFLDFTIKTFEERKEKRSNEQDMLNAFLQLHDSAPSKISEADIVGAIYINLVAGHDVLAVTLRSIFYFICKTPDVQAKLRREVCEASAPYSSSVAVPNNVNNSLSYLDAVIYESLRMHPNTGTILERSVPAGGIEIDGYLLAGGTTVGCNAWVIHRNQDVFGEDVHVFRPERWLGISTQKASEMKNTIFSFGLGPRMCVGRNIAWLQIEKVVVELIRRFSFELAHPTREWKVNGAWITKQTEMDVKIKRLS